MTEIAIVGGGIGGLTLARVLRVHGLEATVYDRDASPDDLPQRGSLDLSEDHGQHALRLAGLDDEFRRRYRAGADAIKIYDHTGTCLFEDVDEDDRMHPEIDRIELRQMLLDSLDPESIVWGRKATAVDASGPRPEVRFEDGSVAQADLVVGADGAWSAVRPAVSSVPPEYSGVALIELQLVAARERHPACAATVGRGTMVAMEDGQGVMGHSIGHDGSIRVYVSFLEDEQWLLDLRDRDREAIKVELLGRLDGWSEDLLRLIVEADDDPILRPVYELPTGHRWDRVPGVTLIGDAAHLMSPFGGHGANLAMLDGARLATLLAESPDDLEAALIRYEEELFPRSEQFASETAGNIALFHGPDAPRKLVELFTAFRLPAA
jgi:2-polyprenyl-6-methoxyphenol hydroxylase-like FAD-dependent oxidoreductase